MGDYLQTAIFEPAGMSSTFYDLSLGQGREVHRQFVWNGGYNTGIAVSAGERSERRLRWFRAAAALGSRAACPEQHGRTLQRSPAAKLHLAKAAALQCWGLELVCVSSSVQVQTTRAWRWMGRALCRRRPGSTPVSPTGTWGQASREWQRTEFVTAACTEWSVPVSWPTCLAQAARIRARMPAQHTNGLPAPSCCPACRRRHVHSDRPAQLVSSAVWGAGAPGAVPR